MISRERIVSVLSSEALRRRGRTLLSLRFSLADVWVASVFVVPAIALLQSKLSMLDLAYHVRAGNLMLAAHHVLRTDPFSFASNGNWLDQQWLAQVVLATASRVRGWLALEILRVALGGAVPVAVYAACRARDAHRKRAAVIAIVAAILSLPGLALRPQLFGLVLFALVQLILLERDRRPTLLALLPPLFVVWANVHGTFPLGILLIFIALVEQLERRSRIRPLGIVLVVSVLATGATPWGFGVWRYLVEISTNPRITSWVQEWQPSTLRSLPGAEFFVSVAAVVAVLARSRTPLRWSSILTLVLFFVLGVWSIRGIYWWAVVAAPVVASILPGRDTAATEQRSLANGGLVLGMLLLLLALLIPWTLRPTSLLLDAPSEMSDRLLAVVEPGDRVLTAQRWGSWFEYRLPGHSIFVDSRIELYPDNVWRDYFSVSGAASGWQQILDRWGIDFVAAERREQPKLLGALERVAGWRTLYRGPDGVLFART